MSVGQSWTFGTVSVHNLSTDSFLKNDSKIIESFIESLESCQILSNTLEGKIMAKQIEVFVYTVCKHVYCHTPSIYLFPL